MNQNKIVIVSINNGKTYPIERVTFENGVIPGGVIECFTMDKETGNEIFMLKPLNVLIEIQLSTDKHFRFIVIEYNANA